ncbi:MAG: pyridoxal phosphate-dependent aminotransferase [Planctomycetota bacterium]
MVHPLDLRSARTRHLAGGNLLRSLTEVIDAVPGGINLGQGVCDLDPPAPLVAGAVAAIQGGDRQVYTPFAGLPSLREAVARKLRDFNGIEVGAAGVTITPGSSGAFLAAILALFDPGDPVILFEPFYSYHRAQLLVAGLRPVPVRLVGPELALDLPAVRAAVAAGARGLVLNTPANPSGRVFSQAELLALGRELQGSPCVVLTDEVYEYMVFDGARHVSPATVPGLTDRCVTISSFSKTYSVTGWRVGYAAGREDLIEAIGRVADQAWVCASRPAQRGVERALRELPARFYEDLRAGYQSRRDRFCDALEDAGFRFARPQGAYYVLADYRDVFGDLDPHPAVLRMIERVRINAVPGHVFCADPSGVRTMRFHFAVGDAVLDEACARLRSLK